MYIFPQDQFFQGWFFSTCRTDLIRRALCSPDLGGSSKYLQHAFKVYRKFFTLVWSPETRIFQNTSQNLDDLKPLHWMSKCEFSKVLVFRGAIFSTCRTDFIRCALCFPDLGASSKYLQHVFKVYRKSFTSVWSPENGIFQNLSQNSDNLRPLHWMSKCEFSTVLVFQTPGKHFL